MGRSARLLLFLAGSLALAGCVTSGKYRMAKSGQPPAQSLDWSSETDIANVTLEAAIFFQGPGSWKQEARWDEYVVRISNRTGRPLRIEGASLVDLLGQAQAAGSDPWAIEKLSAVNWEKYRELDVNLSLGVSVPFLYGTTAGFVGLGGGLATMNGLLVAFPFLVGADVVTVALLNERNRNLVEAEFARRRLALPVTLAPGAEVRGSWFFPTTPGPRRLVLNGRAGEEPVRQDLDLSRFAAVHLASPGMPADRFLPDGNPGMGVVTFYREGDSGFFSYQESVAVKEVGKVLGVMPRGTSVSLLAVPGSHTYTASTYRPGRTSLLEANLVSATLEIEAGKTYYLRLKNAWGWFLEAVPEDTAKGEIGALGQRRD
jgi:hypothetical protein